MAERGACTQASPVKLFATPLSQQRYAFAANVMAQRGARAFVDLGCGEARLMEHFCKQARALFQVMLQWSPIRQYDGREHNFARHTERP